MCPAVDTWTCNGGTNQNFTFSAGGQLASVASAQHPSLCLEASTNEAQTCTNVWGRVLSDGYALGFVNNGGNAVSVTCDPSCFAALNITATSLKVGAVGLLPPLCLFVQPSGLVPLQVRDIWAHEDVAHIQAPFTFSAIVNGSGFAALFKLTPA